MAVKGANSNEVPESETSDDGGSAEDARHGSMRKVLHSLVGNDSLVGKSAKMLDRPKTKVEDDTYAEYLREYSIISEYNILCDHLIPGLYIIPSAFSSSIWFGVIFVRSGLYKGGIFRFRLIIPEDFPHISPPGVEFEREIFHPAIHPETNALNVSSVFPQWSKTANRLWQVLEYCNSIFYQIPAKCPLNVEAAQLYEQNRDEFARRAEQCAQDSSSTVHLTNGEINDPHYIRFSPFSDKTHAEAHRQLKSNEKRMVSGPASRGLSWVQPGSLKPCSKILK